MRLSTSQKDRVKNLEKAWRLAKDVFGDHATVASAFDVLKRMDYVDPEDMNDFIADLVTARDVAVAVFGTEAALEPAIVLEVYDEIVL